MPLPVHGSILWQPATLPQGTDGSAWQTSLTLPPVPEGHILVPSYSCLTQGHQYQWRLLPSGLSNNSPAHTDTLAPVLGPDTKTWTGFQSQSKDIAAIEPKIDCWHSIANIDGLTAQLTVFLPETSEPPERDLLVFSIRPISLSADDIPRPSRSVQAPCPVAISQMLAEPSIAKRICSPSATVMAVAGSEAEHYWPAAVSACYDPQTKAYGKWPLAVHWATQVGRLGAIEALANWEPALALLESGQSLVCSIRFAQGELPEAPLAQTGGHLVVLYGIDIEQDQAAALVMDPAGPDREQVCRRYPLDRFTRAWLGQRGGTYLFAPSTATTQGPHASSNQWSSDEVSSNGH